MSDRSPGHRAAGAVLAGLSLLLAACVARAPARGAPPPAARRIVLLDLQRTPADRLDGIVAGILTERHQVIGPDEYRRAARRLKARRLRPRDITAVAQELSADGVVSGRLARTPAGFRLELELRDGTTGRITRRLTVATGKRRMSTEAQRRLSQDLLAAIDALPGHRAPLPDAAPADGPAGAAQPAPTYDERGQALDEELPPRVDSAE